MKILSKQEIQESLDAIKEGNYYRVVACPTDEEDLEKMRLFKHDIKGALRTFKFIADKSIPQDQSAINIKKREVVEKHLESLKELLQFYDDLSKENP